MTAIHRRRRKQWHPTPVLLPGKSHGQRSLVGCSPWGREELDTTERLHFHFHDLEKEMATHSSVLAWRILGTAEPGGLPSMGSHRVGHDWSDLAAALYLRDPPTGHHSPSSSGYCGHAVSHRKTRCVFFKPWGSNLTPSFSGYSSKEWGWNCYSHL